MLGDATAPRCTRSASVAETDSDPSRNCMLNHRVCSAHSTNWRMADFMRTRGNAQACAPGRSPQVRSRWSSVSRAAVGEMPVVGPSGSRNHAPNSCSASPARLFTSAGRGSSSAATVAWGIVSTARSASRMPWPTRSSSVGGSSGRESGEASRPSIILPAVMQLLDASAEPFRRGPAQTREAFGQLIKGGRGTEVECGDASTQDAHRTGREDHETEQVGEAGHHARSDHQPRSLSSFCVRAERDEQAQERHHSQCGEPLPETPHVVGQEDDGRQQDTAQPRNRGGERGDRGRAGHGEEEEQRGDLLIPDRRVGHQNRAQHGADQREDDGRRGGELLAAGKEMTEDNDRPHGRDDRQRGSDGVHQQRVARIG